MQLLLCVYCIENSLHFYHHLGDRLLVEWTGHSGWFSINWLLSNHPSSNQTTDKEEAIPTHPTVSIPKLILNDMFVLFIIVISPQTTLPYLKYEDIMEPSNEGLFK